MNSSYPTNEAGANGTDLNGVAVRNAFRFTTRRDQPAGPGSTAPVSPPAGPPKTRPRGRFLIALLMLLACSVGVATVWESLIRYRAYGVVTGRIIHVGVPMDGVLTSVHVSEGQTVQQDAQLAKVVDIEFEQQLARVSDELRVAEATLQAEIARVQWQSHVEETEMTKSIAELFESAGRMHSENGSLNVLRYQLGLNRELHQKHASLEADLTTFEIQEKAKKEELDSIEQAIVVLKQRAERAVSSPRLGAEQIQPMIAKSDMLLNEISRLRERIAQGELRSPVNGTVLRRHQMAGECVKSHDPLFSVIEESSMEVEVYLPQHISGAYKVGDTIKLKIEPIEELVPCEVVSIGVEHRKPPENIEVFYRSNVRLLPIRVKPLAPYADGRKLSVGSVAKLPHFDTLL